MEDKKLVIKSVAIMVSQFIQFLENLSDDMKAVVFEDSGKKSKQDLEFIRKKFAFIYFASLSVIGIYESCMSMLNKQINFDAMISGKISDVDIQEYIKIIHDCKLRLEIIKSLLNKIKEK